MVVICIFITSKWWKQRAVNDVTRFCACVVELELLPPSSTDPLLSCITKQSESFTMATSGRTSVRVARRWLSANFDRQVGRSGKTLLLGYGPAAAGNGSQVFIASMLTVLRLISLTVALAAGSARVTALGASIYIVHTLSRPIGVKRLIAQLSKQHEELSSFPPGTIGYNLSARLSSASLDLR